MMVSVWWIVWAFVAGGYLGALLLGLLSMTGRREGVHDRESEAVPRKMGAIRMFGGV